MGVTCGTHAQWNYSGSDIYNTNGGNVGIGTTVPLEKLSIEAGSIGLTNSGNDAASRYITCHSQTGQLLIGADVTGSTSSGPHIQMVALQNTSMGREGQIWYHSSTASGNPGHVFYNYDPVYGWLRLMSINEDIVGGTPMPKVVIGNRLTQPGQPGIPGNYSLYVENGILTEHIRVSGIYDVANWKDYVFDNDYNLLSLGDLERYIIDNHHLPDIPSAKQVAAEGIDLAEMDAKLLQKIEELTLYILKQQKEIDMLKANLSK